MRRQADLEVLGSEEAGLWDRNRAIVPSVDLSGIGPTSLIARALYWDEQKT